MELYNPIHLSDRRIKAELVNGKHYRCIINPPANYSTLPIFPVLADNTSFEQFDFKPLNALPDNSFNYFKYRFNKQTNVNYHCEWELIHDIEESESFYGLGDKAVKPNLRGRKCILWGTDTYAYGYGNEPLYKNIPYFISNKENECIGIFILNSFRQEYDFGYSSPHQLKIIGSGGIPDIFFIRGKSPIEIASEYAILTGRPKLPPLWALGYHQSKWSYSPESKFREVANIFRSKKIPCDCLYLDIDYMRGYRVFTWDKRSFPAPEKLLEEVSAQGFKTVAILDPGIKIDQKYIIFKEAKKGKYFMLNPDNSPATGPVWPGYCHFPDFTNSVVRNWWADHVETLLKSGINGLWNDMNEPALFNRDDMIQTQRTLDDEVKLNFEGRGATFAEGHNIYGMMMSKATFDGMQKTRDKRPFLLTRSTFAGGQKYAAVWTGDNVASWEHLRIANYQCQSLSISGFSFSGSDIGGFVGNPDGELFCRWLQLAIFHSFCRTHSSKDFKAQEPWSFGDQWTVIARKLIEWRYKLIGYLYSVFFQHTQNGIPFLVPVTLKYWKDNRFKNHHDFFFVGDALLVIPVMEPGQRGIEVFLPPGKYYQPETGKYFSGENHYHIPIGYDDLPVLLKGGHFVPIWPVMQYIGESPMNSIEWWLGYSDEKRCESFYYLDEFDGYDNQMGKFKKVKFIYTKKKNVIHIDILREGSYLPDITQYKLSLFGFAQIMDHIEIDSKRADLDYKNQQITFTHLPETISIYLKD